MELPQPRQKYEHWGWRALSQGKEETSSGQPATNWGAQPTSAGSQQLHTHQKDTRMRVTDRADESHRQSRPRV